MHSSPELRQTRPVAEAYAAPIPSLPLTTTKTLTLTVDYARHEPRRSSTSASIRTMVWLPLSTWMPASTTTTATSSTRFSDATSFAPAALTSASGWSRSSAATSWRWPMAAASHSIRWKGHNLGRLHRRALIPLRWRLWSNQVWFLGFQHCLSSLSRSVFLSSFFRCLQWWSSSIDLCLLDFVSIE